MVREGSNGYPPQLQQSIQPMTIDESIYEDMSIVALSGRLDALTAPEVEQRLLSRIEQPPVNLLLNLKELNYISSAGLRVVLVAAKKTIAAKGQFILCGMNEQIRTIFDISGFLTILRVVESCEDIVPSESPV